MTGAIPDAWPCLLTREQLCAYLGISAETLIRICPVPALELGVKLWRWRRSDIDDWAAGLPSRQQGSRATGVTRKDGQSEAAADERRAQALERARLRTSQNLGQGLWKKAQSHSFKG